MHPRSRAAYAGLICTLSAACTTSKPVTPGEYIPKYAPDVVWVTAADKSVVPVEYPQVTGDTLTGTRKGTRQQITVPLQDVQTVTVKLHDPKKTALLVGGMLLFTTAMLYEYWISNEGPNTAGVNCGVYESAAQGNPSGAFRPDC